MHLKNSTVVAANVVATGSTPGAGASATATIIGTSKMVDLAGIERKTKSGKRVVLEGKDVVEKLSDKLKNSLHNEANYCYLFYFVCYALLYLGIFAAQTATGKSFEVEEAIRISLFGATEVANGEVIQSLSSPADVYKWIDTQIISPSFADPICGDGKCDSPQEFQSWGEYGCAADCGSYPRSKLTQVSIELTTHFQSQAELAEAAWNLYSSTHEVYLFLDDRRFRHISGTETTSVFLPDGEWEVEIFALNGGVSGRVFRETQYLVNQTASFSEVTYLNWTNCKSSDDSLNEEFIRLRDKTKTECSFLGVDYNICGPRESCQHCQTEELCGQHSTCGVSDDGAACYWKTCNNSAQQCDFCEDTTSCVSSGCFHADIEYEYVEPFLGVGCYYSECSPCSSCDILSDACDRSNNCFYDQGANRCKLFCAECGECPSSATCNSNPDCSWNSGLGRCQHARRRLDNTEVSRRLETSTGTASASTVVCSQNNPCEACFDSIECHKLDGCDFDYKSGMCYTEDIEVGNQKYPAGCAVSHPNCTESMFANSACNPECNNPECRYDGGDCSDTYFLLQYECSEGCFCNMLNNGQCDAACNNIRCGLDLGDCCLRTFQERFRGAFSLYEKSPAGNVTRLTPDPKISLKRYVGRTNRLLGGVFLNQRRKQLISCTSERFSELTQGECYSEDEVSSEAFGADPVFLRSSSLANKNLRSSDFYNLSDKTEVNSLGIPYGFHYTSVAHSAESGFPIYFDVNFDGFKAQEVMTYAKEGGYLDAQSKDLSLRMLTYNPNHELFAYIYLLFTFETGGRIKLDYTLQTMSVELYNSRSDLIRLGFEILFVFLTGVDLCAELKDAVTSKLSTGYVFGHFRSIWNYIDLINIALFVYLTFLWATLAVQAERSYGAAERYEVYVDIHAEGRFLQYNEAELEEMMGSFRSTEAVALRLSNYVTTSAIAMILLISRLLKVLDFQQKIGIVTRTIQNAAIDLFHWLILFSFIFFSYAFMGFAVFGSAISDFSTVGSACNTCFAIIMGEIKVSEKLLTQPNYFATHVYYYSFLTLVFFILVNVFLAILVDAYIEVKKSAAHSESLPFELFRIFKRVASRPFEDKSTYMSDQTIIDLINDWVAIAEAREGTRGDRVKLNIDGFEVRRDLLEEVLYSYITKEKQKINTGVLRVDTVKRTVAARQTRIEALEPDDVQKLCSIIAENVLRRHGIDDPSTSLPTKAYRRAKTQGKIRAVTPIASPTPVVSPTPAASETPVLPED